VRDGCRRSVRDRKDEQIRRNHRYSEIGERERERGVGQCSNAGYTVSKREGEKR